MLKKNFVFMAALVVLAASGAYAATADVPKTGQTTISATGDDGDKKAGIAWPSARFTTNADTTVTDKLTSLVWAPNGNVMPARDANWDQDGTVNDGRVTWQHALDYVAKLNTESYLGHTDWRLPNLNEFESLVHAEYTNTTLCGGSGCSDNAAWLNSQGFTNVQAGSYWSSTTYAAYTSYAWFVDIFGGHVVYAVKTYNYYVWPVRSGQ